LSSLLAGLEGLFYSVGENERKGKSRIRTLTLNCNHRQDGKKEADATHNSTIYSLLALF